MSEELSLSETFSKIILSFPNIVWHENYFPFGILITIHAIFISLRYKNNLKEVQVPWLQGLFAVSVMGVGGSTISNILIGKPPGWLTSNSIITAYWTMYSLINYVPPLYWIIKLLPSDLLNIIFLTVDGMLRALAICSSGVDSVRYGSFHVIDNKSINSSWVAILISGTLCGCGGGILDSAFNVTSPTWTFSTPSAFVKPTYDMKVSFYIALFYALTTVSNEHEVTNFTIQLFSINQGKILAILGMVTLNLAKLGNFNIFPEQNKIKIKEN
ncbi:7289_t:CDS:2 [Funneliformis mosseae]|uniref:7289_t:CDS:1 n=1 Tax=Funneliformis mosseae TaxID=27381 RepID=A0A9N9B0H3_FUNMO|nr:7289_t:CDS:2 [Funneliformis mosseae]